MEKPISSRVEIGRWFTVHAPATSMLATQGTMDSVCHLKREACWRSFCSARVWLAQSTPTTQSTFGGKTERKNEEKRMENEGRRRTGHGEERRCANRVKKCYQGNHQKDKRDQRKRVETASILPKPKPREKTIDSNFKARMKRLFYQGLECKNGQDDVGQVGKDSGSIVRNHGVHQDNRHHREEKIPESRHQSRRSKLHVAGKEGRKENMKKNEKGRRNDFSRIATV
jgi:hypothetical protein